MSDGVARTKILLLGLRRSGKTSIQQETFYLDATMRTVKHTYDTVIPLEIWDCPGNITVETLGAPLSVFSTVVFVIDIRDLYNQPISRLVEFIVAAYHQNPSLNFEIFVHKAEKLQEDEKIENFRQINERVMDRLVDMVMNFHLTSIFDHSLHQAFSSVLQRLITSLEIPKHSRFFLFDARSRLYVATDHSPVDATTHNLCCDNLAMLNAFGGCTGEHLFSLPAAPTPPPSAASFGENSSSDAYGSLTNSTCTPTITVTTQTTSSHHAQDLFYPNTNSSFSTYPNPTLILLILLPTSVFETRRGLIELNAVLVREGVQEIIDVEREARGTRRGAIRA
ncbi:Gtr1/RagA G protein conserved region-domain-containing protein [Rhodocollybia butyracea]|uniref:GTP-binding protein n=1 Tax=Rhodocollybia butyracea TaxID=206335 RepID=A0A9P5QCX3_9AGAR|nr:Gtr1/RagA G protein conserved region-domain-containing protein [Rhodocollybia butyracea]